MKKLISRDEIRNEVHKTESAFDEALLQSAKLMQRMIVGRQNPAVPKNAGHEAIIQLAIAQQQLIDGSSGVFKVHEELGRFVREFADKDPDDDTVDPRPTGYIKASKPEYSK